MTTVTRSRALLTALWNRWARIAKIIGTFQARVLLTVFYFVVIPPFALIVKILKDPLTLRPPRTGAFWIERNETTPSSTASRRQF